MAKAKKVSFQDRPLLSKRNWKWFSIGLAVIALGYICLVQKPYSNPLSVTVAPILLTIGYCVLVPLALVLNPHKAEKSE